VSAAQRLKTLGQGYKEAQISVRSVMGDATMGKELHASGIFQRRPDEPLKESTWKIIRCGATERLTGIVLSHDLTGCFTHFWKHRTVPCMAPDPCVPCQAADPRRWHSWFAALVGRHNDQAIVEITLRATGYFDDAFRSHRTLRGQGFTLCRVPSRANGKLLARLGDGAITSDLLQKAPNVERLLLQMWEMPDQPMVGKAAPAMLRPLPGQTEFLK
jgi:hypothetical protein